MRHDLLQKSSGQMPCRHDVLQQVVPHAQVRRLRRGKAAPPPPRLPGAQRAPSGRHATQRRHPSVAVSLTRHEPFAEATARETADDIEEARRRGEKREARVLGWNETWNNQTQLEGSAANASSVAQESSAAN